MNVTSSALIQFTAWLSQNGVNLLIQSTVLISFGLLAAYLVRQRGSAVQSAIYRATLVAVLACPLATIALNQLGFDGWSIRLPETTRSIMVAEIETTHPLPVPVDISPNRFDSSHDVSTIPIPLSSVELRLDSESTSIGLPLTTPSIANESSGPIGPLHVIEPRMVEQIVPNPAWVATYAIIGLAWLTGVTLFLVRLIWAYRKLNLMRRESSQATDLEQTLCAQLATSINVRTPDVRRNSHLFSPCLTGITSPMILLPVEIRDQIPLEKAFAHELAHLRRHDTLWNLIQRIALALFFYQPLLWRLVYRLETTAEEVCDDYVVSHCMDRTGYAQQLVDLAESNLLVPNMAGLGMFTSKSILGHRIVRILDSTRTLTTQISFPMVVCIASLAIICATLGGFLGNGKSPLTVFNSADETAGESTKIEELDPRIKLLGRVLYPDGSAVANATVSVFPGVSATTAKHNPPAYTTTKSQRDGTFEVSFSKSSLILSGSGYERERNYCLIASADGYGINWIDADELEDSAIETIECENLVFTPVDIRLTTDETKTKLLLIDTEGNPVAGASVKVTRISRFANEDISPFYDSQARGEAYIQRSISDDLIIHGLPEFNSNEKGEIVLDGLGDNRIAHLEITGPGIAIRTIRVATTDADTVSVTFGGMPKKTTTTYGAKSTITCEPTQPIVGRVFDLESDQPLAGVKIMSSQFAGEKVAGVRILQTESDEKGRFRLTGMPKGPGNTIIAVPNDEHPYFMLRFDVPAGTGLEPVEMELPLQRGVFIRGRATDLKTGEPIAGATLNYLPFLSNDLAAASPVYADNQFMEIQNRYQTGLDGSFQVVGFPGRGVVGINVHEDYYPSGMGWESIDDEEKLNDEDGQVKTFRQPIYPSKKWPTAMVQVDVADLQKELVVAFQLDHGLSIPVRITDSDDQPLTGVEVARLRSSNDYSYTTTEPIVNATAFSKNETRILKFVHRGKSLSRVAELDSSVLDPAGELAEPVHVKLMPGATVTGILVDGNGDAIERGEVRFDIGGSRDFGMSLPMVTTDKNGQISIDNVPSGTHYSISVATADNFFSVNDHLDVEAGEHINLGTINVDNEVRPDPKRTRIHAGSEPGEKPDTADPNFKGAHSIVIRGQLNDENGAPIVDGDVAVIAHKNVQVKTFESGPTGSILAESKTGSNGRFEIKLDDVDAASYREAFIIANAETRALTWKQLDLSAKETVESIVLPAEELIRGQFLDLDGRPAKNVPFRIGAVIQRTNSSDSWTNIKFIQPDIDKIPKAWLSPSQSDHEGNFQIHSISANHGVSFQIDGDDRFSPQGIMLCSGLAETRGDRDGTFRPLVKNPALGEVAKLTLNASQIFEGTVTYADTGEPAAFAKLVIWASQQELGSRVGVFGRADKDGKFKLNPNPGHWFALTAFPPSGVPYLVKSSEEIIWDAGDFRRTVDIELPRGVLVKGAVVDSETYKPLAGATVQYGIEIANNKNQIDQAASGLQNIQLTNDKGQFEITVVPGPGRLFVKAEGNYAQKAVGSNEFNLFLGPRGEDRQCVNAIIELDPESSDSTIQLPPIKIEKDYRASGSFVDSENKPVDSFKLVSDLETYAKRVNWILLDEPTPGSEFDLRGLSPDKVYTVSAIAQIRNIGATFTLRAGDKPTVKLLDCGVATARLVDSGGTPLAGIEPKLTLVVPQGKLIESDNETSKVKRRPEATDVTNTGRPNRTRYLVTNAEGRISWGPLIPGATYEILHEIGGKTVSLKEFQVKPGEKLDLGTIDATKVDSEPMSELNSDHVQSNSDLLPVSSADVEQESITAAKGIVDDSNDQTRTGATDHVIQGIVTDKDGNPVSRASVRFNSWKFSPVFESTILAETQSDAAGRFELKIDGQKFAQLVSPDNKNIFAGLIVRADGYGSVQTDWADNINNEPLKILLPVENRLAGRVVDLEGNPVVGAKVHFTFSKQLGEQVADRFLDSLQQTGKFASASDIFLEQQNAGLNGFNEAVNPLVETNQQGEFEFRGIPRDSLLTLRIEHPQVVTQMVSALARSMDAVDADPQYKVFGDHPLIVTQPCRPIVGTVVDSKTGEPIAGATVLCTEMGIRNTAFWSSPAPRTLTDDKGRFELLGVPKSDRTELMVYPPNDLPWLIKEVKGIPDTVGLEPVDMLIELHRGIWIEGQVTDSQTGEGVQGEMVYLPLKDNPHLIGVEGYQAGRSFESFDFLQQFDTDEKGHFRFAGLPGKAVLGAQVHSQDYRSADGYDKVLNEFGSEYSPEQIEIHLEMGRDLRGKKFLDIRTLSFVWRNQFGSSYVGIDPPTSTDEVVQNIQMDAGHDMTIRVVDSDGNPVERFEVSGFDGFYGKREFALGTCTLTRIGDDEKRTLWIRGIDRPIGAIVEIDGAHRDPSSPSEYRTVSLESYGTVRGRLIDKENKPLANYSVTATYGVETTTNEKGEFEISEVFAGQKFDLKINAPGEREFYMFAPNKELEPGQTLELGPVNFNEMVGPIITSAAG